MAVLGEAFVRILPETGQFQPRLNAAMRTAGTRGASEYERQFETAFGKGRPFAPITTQATRESAKAGKESAEMFSKTLSGALVTLGALQVGRSVGRFFGGAIQDSITFETAFTGVRKTVQATDEQFKKLEQGIRDMSLELPLSAQEIARVVEVAGQVGVSASNLLSFTRTAVAMGEATELSAEEAAVALAKFAAVTQTPVTNVEALGSSLATLADRFNANEQALLEFSQRAGGAASAAGFAAGEILGVGAALLETSGVEAEAVGGAAGAVIQEIIKAVTAATPEAERSLELFASVAGKTAEEFQRAWRDDAATAFADFAQGLGEQGDSAGAILEELGIGDRRLTSVFQNAARNVGVFTEGIELGNRAFAENTRLQEELAKRLATNAAQQQLATNRFAETRRELGDRLAPVATGVLQLLSRVPAVAVAAGAALAGIAAVGALYIVLQGRIAAVRKELETLGPSAQKAGVAMSRIGTALKGISIATGIFVAIDLLRSAGESLGLALDKLQGFTGKGIADVTSAVLDVAEGTGTASEALKAAGVDAQRFGDALDKLTTLRPSDFLKFPSFEHGKEARAELDKLDKALAAIVQSGNIPAANAAFEKFNKALKFTPEQKAAFLDDFTEALAENKKNAKQNAAEQKRLENAMNGVGTAADVAAADALKLSQANELAAQAAQGAAAAFLQSSAAFDARLGTFLPNFGDTFRQESDKASGAADGLADAARRVGRAEEDGARRIADARRSLREAIEDSNAAIAESERRLNQAREDGARRVLEAQRAIEASRRASRLNFRDAQQRLQDLEADLASTGGAVTTAAQRELRDAQQAVADARRSGADSETEGERSLADAQREQAEQIAEAQRSVAEAHEDAAERVAEAQRRVREAQRETAEAIGDAMRSIGKASAKVARNQEITVASLTASFRTNAADLNSFVTSLETISERASGVAEEELVGPFLAHLAELGPGAAPLLRNLSKVSDAELGRIVTLFGTQIKAAKAAADLQFDKYPRNFEEKLKPVNSVITTQLDLLVDKFEAFPPKTQPAIDESIAQMEALAHQMEAARDRGEIALTDVQNKWLETALSAKTPTEKATAFRNLLDSIEGKRAATLDFKIKYDAVGATQIALDKVEVNLISRGKVHGGMAKVPGSPGAESAGWTLQAGERVVDADTNEGLTLLVKEFLAGRALSGTSAPVVGTQNIYEVVADPRVTAMQSAEAIGRLARR